MKTPKDDTEQSMELTEQVNKDIESVILELKQKARDKTKSANRFFYLIIVILVIGVIVFIFAYKFNASSDMKQIFDSQEKLFREYLAEAKDVDSKYDAYRSLVLASIAEGLYESRHSMDTVSRNGVGRLIMQLIPDASSFSPLLASNPVNIDSIALGISKEVESVILTELKTSNYEVVNLINTALVRFGSVVIILFLVQVLIRVFRYNVRLANFYNARANALEVYLANREHSDKLTLEMITAMLSPDSIDIGVQKNPTDHFSDWVKAALNKTPA